MAGASCAAGTWLLLLALLVPAPLQAQGAAECQRCHGNRDFLTGKGGSAAADSALYVPDARLAETAHAGLRCASCHLGYDRGYPHRPPRAGTIPTPLVRFESPAGEVWVRSCGDCHGAVLEEVAASVHRAVGGLAGASAACVRCHGAHEVYGVADQRSRVHPLREVGTCGACHGGSPGAVPGSEHAPAYDVVSEYRTTAHGRALVRAGLVVAATCSECHRAHRVAPPDAPGSSLYRDSVAATCGECHPGILETYLAARHGQRLLESDAARGERSGKGAQGVPTPVADTRRAPVCTDCHVSHHIAKVGEPAWRLQIVQECGTCHEALYQTYLNTYHGKETALGRALTAKCSDCHTAHDVRPASDPLSTVSSANVVRTCRTCHPHAGERFARYLTHGDPRDRAKYPILYWTSLVMTVLLIGAFGVSGLHAVLWTGRAWIQGKRARRYERGAGEGVEGKTEPAGGGHSAPEDGALARSAGGRRGAGGQALMGWALSASDRGSGPYYWRFRRIHRVLHAGLVVAFLGLVFTGMPLHFWYTSWARAVIKFLGGPAAAGVIHRVCAVVVLGCLFVHLGYLGCRLARGSGRRELLSGSGSMLPRSRDLRDLVAMFRWFLRGGTRPRFERFSYVEKLDYWAVMVGLVILGSMGLLLWFPEFFGRFLPGWMFNVASILHGELAILAAGFIFAIHFFNTSLRPGRFPIDTVIFTGRATAQYLEREHPLEVERLRSEGRLDALRAPAPSRAARAVSAAFGFAAMALGLALLGLLVWTALR